MNERLNSWGMPVFIRYAVIMVNFLQEVLIRDNPLLLPKNKNQISLDNIPL